MRFGDLFENWGLKSMKLNGKFVETEFAPAPDVFISYSDHVPQVALQIADALKEAGISCWIARRNLPPGGVFSERIMQAIDGCKVFLLVLDQHSIRSRYVMSEVVTAFERKSQNEPMEFLTFHADDSNIREHRSMYFFINQFQYIEANPPNAEHIGKLVKRIADILRERASVVQSVMPSSNIAPHSWNPPVNIIQGGPCGEFVTYALDESGALTISGSGNMWDFWDYQNDKLTLPWEKRRNNIIHARIQSGVTSIGKMAFSDCANLSKVEIADSVIDIRAWAFQNCASLREISIPVSVREIGAYAFQGCVNLSYVSIPRATRVNESAFPATTRRESLF